MGGAGVGWDYQRMRFNLAALAHEQKSAYSANLPVSVQLRPSRGLPGEHLYMTDSRSLMNMLKRTTDLSGCVLDGFLLQLKSASAAKLSGVELSDRTLHEIGYFVD